VDWVARETVLTPVEVVTVVVSWAGGAEPALTWKGLEYWKTLGLFSYLTTKP
jgi:hypothetical protein